MTLLNTPDNFMGPPEPPKVNERFLLGAMHVPNTPEFENQRQLSEIYKNPNDVTDYSFFGKLGVAARTETATAELFSDWFGPRFEEEEDFVVTDQLKYVMSDLPEEAQQRIAESARSTNEFLHEVDDARKMIKLREELFAGGTLGVVGGFGATLLMAGGEAAALTTFATALGGLTGGPVGAGAGAAASTIAKVQRINKIKKTFEKAGAAWAVSQRSAAVTKALGIAAAIDVPLELTRWANDKTLTEKDFWFALAASGTLTGGLAAWKPGIFANEIWNQASRKINEEAAEIAESMGDVATATAIRADADNISFVDPTLAGEIGATRRSAAVYRQSAKEAEAAGETDRAAFLREQADAEDIQVKNLEAQSVPIEKLSKAQFDSEIERLGISSRQDKNGKWLDSNGKQISKKNLEARLKERREDTLRSRMVEEQVTRLVNKTEGTNSLRKLADRFKVDLPKKIRDNPDAIRSAIVKAVVSASREGGIKTAQPIDIPESLKVFAGKTIQANKTQVQFKDDVDRLLYEAGLDKDFDGKESLINLLEEYGIKGVRQLAREMREGVDAEIKSGRHQGKTIGVNHEDFLQVPSLIKTVRKPLDLEFDDDILFKFGAGFKRAEEAPIDGDEIVYLKNGEEIGRGPNIPGIREHGVDTYAETAGRAYEEGGRTVKGAKGFLEKAARFVGGTGERMVGTPIGAVFHHLNRLLTPMAHTLQSYDSEVVQGITNAFIAASRGSGVNVHTQLREIYEREVGDLMEKLYSAALSYKKLTGKKMGPEQHREIFRKLTMGEADRPALAEWEEIGIKAVERFNKRLKDYAVKNGFDIGDIPNPSTYLKRIWDTTKFHDHSKSDLVDFFRKAVLSGMRKLPDGLPENAERVAKAAAERIVDFGSDPSIYRSRAKGVEWEKTTREKLADDGYSSEEIDDIVDVIVDSASLQKEPHQSFAKRRITLNENFEDVIGGEMVHIDNFMNRNLDDVIGRYAHSVIGAVETRKGFKAVGQILSDSNPYKKVFKENTSSVEVKKAAHEEIRNNYRGKESKEKIQSRIKYFDWCFDRMYTVATGQRMYEVDENWMKFAMGLQALSQATIGTFLGVAQLPEIAGVMCRSGLKASMSAMPSLKEMGNTFGMLALKEKGLRGADGRMGDKMAALSETMFAVGRDYNMREHFTRRLDDLGYDPSLRSGWFARVLEGGRMFGLMNPLGIMPMDTFLRRWGARAHFQSFVNQAYDIKNGKGVVNDNWWRRSRTRFRELGLSDNEIDRITKELGRDGVLEVKEGIFGGYKVLDIDIDKIQDQKAYDIMVTAVRRAVDSTVQRQSMGEMPAWMSAGGNLGVLGKLWSQYRVFSITARAKQLAAGIARSDGTEAIQLVGSAGLGYVGFQLMLYVRSLNPQYSEQEIREMYEENSGIEAALKSGFMRSSYSTVLPMLWDTLAQIMPGDWPVFNKYMRTTGLGIDPWRGSVPGHLINKGLRAVGVLRDTAGAAVGIEGSYDSLSQRRVMDALGIVPFINAPGLKQLQEISVYSLPLPE